MRLCLLGRSLRQVAWLVEVEISCSTCLRSSRSAAERRTEDSLRRRPALCADDWRARGSGGLEVACEPRGEIFARGEPPDGPRGILGGALARR